MKIDERSEASYIDILNSKECFKLHISIFPLVDFPIINPKDNFNRILIEELKKTSLEENDVLVIAHTVISKAENKIYDLDEIEPSDLAVHIGKIQDKDPRKIEVILRESSEIIRMNERLLITATKHGFICANSGIDKSNSPGETVISLPNDPDLSARKIKADIFKELGKNVAVIISDTFGRPLRVGTTNIAIGLAGIKAIEDYRGKKDLYGYELKVTQVARADEIATAAGLAMGQAGEGTPVIVVRGADYTAADSSAMDLNRDRQFDVFR